jgi:hypothetical protein
MEIRPAVPGPWCDLPQKIASSKDLTAATFIITIIRAEEPAIGRERQPIWISESPAHELRLSPFDGNPQNRSIARYPPRDYLSVESFRSQWREGACLYFRIGCRAKQIFCRRSSSR